MRPWVKGLVIAVVQVGLVASLGAKLLYDRLTLPRVWVLTAPYDPNLPIRGRYVRLRLMVEAKDIPDKPPGSFSASRPAVTLRVENNRLVALADPQEHRYRPVDLHVIFIGSGEARRAVLDKPVAFFIPEHLPDPSRLQSGQELWVEVTVPPQGPPRPIRLGFKHGDGPIVPLATE